MSDNKLRLCKFFALRNNCRDGDSCSYLHDKNACRNYFQGNCRKGNECQYTHIYQMSQSNRGENRDNKNKGKGKGKKGRLIKKNTECFTPSYDLPDLRIKVATGREDTYPMKYCSRDVSVVPGLFTDIEEESEEPYYIYHTLLAEIKKTGKDKLWKLWHGDSHVIADDHQKWKEACPMFNRVIDRAQKYFNMKAKATRLNWYRSDTEWKPYHHDAAAVDPKKSKTQNLTVGISFGKERDIAFQHAESKNTVFIPLPDGATYAFGKDINTIWRHGIPPKESKDSDKGIVASRSPDGRISVIAWGWGDQTQE